MNGSWAENKHYSDGDDDDDGGGVGGASDESKNNNNNNNNNINNNNIGIKEKLNLENNSKLISLFLVLKPLNPHLRMSTTGPIILTRTENVFSSRRLTASC